MGKMIDNTKKFLVVVKQAEAGCDYTIGCGVKVFEIEATTAYAAFKKAMEKLGWWEYYENYEDYTEPVWANPEFAVDFVKVYGVDYEDHGRIFKEFTAKANAKYDQVISEDVKQSELSELTRLAVKYNKTLS